MWRARPPTPREKEEMASETQIGGFKMHMSGGNVMTLKEQRAHVLEKIEKLNALIEREEAGPDVEAPVEEEPLMGEAQGEIIMTRASDTRDPASSVSSSEASKVSFQRKPSARREQLETISDEAEADKIRHHFDEPGPGFLVAFQLGMSLGYCGYVVTSWLYIGAVRFEVFPDCSKVWPFSHEMQAVCEFSVLAFWTFPIFCCIFLLVFLYKDLLGTRLYYEMLCHNVFLDFENIDFFQSSAVRMLLSWMMIAVFMYPATGNLHLKGLKATVAYWIPMVSFIGLLYTSWDIETRLLSLAKYVEREFDDAKTHMQCSVFIRDYLCRDAFMRVRDSSRKQQMIHSTGSYIKAIVKKAQKLCAHEEKWNQPKETVLGGQDHRMDSFWMAFSRHYWVTDFLYCPALEDKRAQKFRWWFRLYFFYTTVLLLFFVYLGIATIVSHLHHQQIIETSFLTRWFKVENFLVVPVGPSHSKDIPKHSEFLFQVADRMNHF
jgi:hypothetical protein